MENKSIVYRGYPPFHCCCDATWRRLPNGEQAVFFMMGGAFEPEPANHVVMSRSKDEGNTWGEVEVVHRSPGCARDLELIPHYVDPKWRERCIPDTATTMSEVVVHEGKITIYLQIHDGHFGFWKTATISSLDNGKTWSEPVSFAPLPRRSMIRNLYRTSWGEYFLPFQYYPTDGDPDLSPMDDGTLSLPLNGVLIGSTPDGPWEQSSLIKGPGGWAEVNVVELSDGSLAMLSRSDEGMLMRTGSTDRGRTWSDFVKTEIPNPASKFRLFKLSDGRIALLLNPNPDPHHPNTKLRCSTGRNPLSLWISSDDMQTWGTKQVITDFPGALEYPDGEIDADEQHLHLAFDYNRHDVIYWKAPIPRA